MCKLTTRLQKKQSYKPYILKSFLWFWLFWLKIPFLPILKKKCIKNIIFFGNIMLFFSILYTNWSDDPKNKTKQNIHIGPTQEIFVILTIFDQKWPFFTLQNCIKTKFFTFHSFDLLTVCELRHWYQKRAFLLTLLSDFCNFGHFDHSFCTFFYLFWKKMY